MKTPMQILKEFFTQTAYIETNAEDEKKVDGVIVKPGDYDDIKNWIIKTINELNNHEEEIDEKYRDNVKKLNTEIDKINNQIDEIFSKMQTSNSPEGQNVDSSDEKTVDSPEGKTADSPEEKNVDSSKVPAMLQEVIKKIKEEAIIEIGASGRSKNKNGKEFGGYHSKVSDPKLNNKGLGGIFTAVNGQKDYYTGEYVKLAKILELITPVIDQMQEESEESKKEENKENKKEEKEKSKKEENKEENKESKNEENKEEYNPPKIENIVAEKMSESGKKAIERNENLPGTKVTKVTLLKKRTAVVMGTLALTMMLTIGSVRGTNVSIVGEHGNKAYVAGVELQIDNALDKYDAALSQLGVDVHALYTELATLKEFSGESDLIGERKSYEYQKQGNKFEEVNEKNKKSHGEDNILAQEDEAKYYIEQYKLLIDIYNNTIKALDEDSKYLDDWLQANQRHMDISEGKIAPNSKQKDLEKSLAEEDKDRHIVQQGDAEDKKNKNAEAIKIIESEINNINQRIEFINFMSQMPNFEEISQGNFENVFESLFQMYMRHSEDTKMEDFIQTLSDNEFDLNVMAEYAKEESPELTLGESMARIGLITNSYKIYMEEYQLDASKINLPSYIQFINQYIHDNPEIGRDGGLFTTLKGEFTQNDMNRGFYKLRQEGAKKEGFIKNIWRNIRTIFNGQRRSEYEKAVDEQTRAIKEAQQNDQSNEK